MWVLQGRPWRKVGLRHVAGVWLPVCAVLFCAALPARGVDLFDGRIRAHGFVRSELRAIGRNYAPSSQWYVSQFAQTLNLEIEGDILPDGWGPIDSVASFVRGEVRFDCIWWDGCGLFKSDRYFGDDARFAPTDEFTNGLTRTKTGVIRIADPMPVHDGRKLVTFWDTPPFDPLRAFSPEGGMLSETFAQAGVNPLPLAAYKRITGAFDEEGYILAPWNRRAVIHSLATLRNVPNATVPGLPLRPVVPSAGKGPVDLSVPAGLWVPNAALARRIDDIDEDGDGFNLRERELRWNHGASQRDHEQELKEAYLDIELFGGRLFLRLGKQQIVWGKTELFRNQDQFNPQDVGLSSLPTLEESRIALWSARAIYSFYDVGPLQDVRLEVAAILDSFQPLDPGTCGEPYAPFLVCAASNGFFAHSYSGLGLAGAEYPEDPWDDIRDLEWGVRLEWRYRRFAFALTDFYGFNDIPTVNRFHAYERKVDVNTGRPLDVYGRPFDMRDPAKLQDQALRYTPINRQLLDFACALSVGVAGQFVPELASDCVYTLFNNSQPLAAAQDPLLSILCPTCAPALADSFAAVIGGEPLLGEQVLLGTAGIAAPLITLNIDPRDGPAPPKAAEGGKDLVCQKALLFHCLSQRLTDEQEALLGCGPFFGTHCDINGIDLAWAEASVLFQALPQFESHGPIATRYERGKTFILPGARGPGDRRYDPLVDGCVLQNADKRCAGSRTLIDPRTQKPFRSEMEALSYNLLQLLAAFGAANDPGCDLNDPITCGFVQAIFNLTGVGRPDLRAGGNARFGRRDFLWHSGGPLVLEFPRRNVFGFAMDFDEDWSKTNWSVEFTWVAGDTVYDNESPNLFRRGDSYNLTISLDRPTFVNFLNANRTLLFNTQLFVRKASEEDFWQVLGTFTINTGYFQDRLISQLTLVHDFRWMTGGVIFDLTWRFSSNFSATFGLASFYGGPALTDDPIYPPQIINNGGCHCSRTEYGGLSVLQDRDEVSLVLRYTF